MLSTNGIWPGLASLILAATVVMGSPGPSTMSATAIGAAFGLRRSLAYLLGLILGTTAVLLAVAAGVIAMLLSLPGMAPFLIAASSLYILYLAFRIATAAPLSRQDRPAKAPAFAGGFLLAVANPKAYFAIAAVFAGTRLGFGQRLTEATVKIAVLTIMIVIIHVVWLMAGVSLSRLLHSPTGSRIVNLLFAAILVTTTIMALLRG